MARPSLPDIWFPEFVRQHKLRPSGDEPVEERWEKWNDLDFDFYDYSSRYFFWLGAPTNAYLTDTLGDMEELISWSTCRYFRSITRQLKGSGKTMPAKSHCPQTLRHATEVGYARNHVDLPQVKVVDDSMALWTPPQQIALVHPPEPPREVPEHLEPFSKRMKKYKQSLKDRNTNKARRSKPRIAPRR